MAQGRHAVLDLRVALAPVFGEVPEFVELAGRVARVLLFDLASGQALEPAGGHLR